MSAANSQFRTPHSELPTPSLSLIAAVSENNVIGREGDLPWHLGSDLRRFKQLTMGHAIIMGRKTWDSLGRPLPGRFSIVLTRDRNWRAKGAEPAHSLPQALQLVRQADVAQDEAFVIGGGDIFELALPDADSLYLTHVHTTVSGNAYFPSINWEQWQLIERSHFQADDRDEFSSSYERWQRREAIGDYPLEA